MSMNPTIPNCPHCKLDNFVYLNVRTWGWQQIIYDDNGEFDSASLENLRSGDSQVIRCTTCKEIRKDLAVSLDDDGILMIEVK